MWSATWPKEVQAIAREFLNDYVQVNVGNSGQMAANHNISQTVEVCHEDEKRSKVMQLMRACMGDAQRQEKVLIFTETKKGADTLTRMLRMENLPALAIHGDKSQQERDWVLQQFKANKSPCMVATDVAARGLDVKDITLVINYDFPNGIEDYVHRIGRTGRAGAKGASHTFFTSNNAKQSRDLVRVLSEANQPVPHELQALVGTGGGGGGRRQWGGGG